ncbi:hypothetical protein B7494_g6951 [Chlorociboria aeruginascens]|nr:hypothetical protein B7494_g6951 [Chlorociboria aeruginascens]
MKFFILAGVLSIASVAMAAPSVEVMARTSDGECTQAGGNLVCCDSKEEVSGLPELVKALLAILIPVTTQVGINCDVSLPICAQQTVCCLDPNTSSNSPPLISILSGNNIPICPVVGL